MGYVTPVSDPCNSNAFALQRVNNNEFLYNEGFLGFQGKATCMGEVGCARGGSRGGAMRTQRAEGQHTSCMYLSVVEASVHVVRAGGHCREVD